MYKNIKIYNNNKWIEGKIKFQNKILEIIQNDKTIVIPFSKIDSIVKEKDITILIYIDEDNNEIIKKLKLQKIDHEQLITSYQSDMPIIEPLLEQYRYEFESDKNDVKKDTKELIIRVFSSLIIFSVLFLINFINLSHNNKLLIFLYFILFLSIVILISTFSNKKNQK